MRKLPWEAVVCFLLAIVAVLAMDQGAFRIFGGRELFPTPPEIRFSWIILILALAQFLYVACATTPTMIEFRTTLAQPLVWLGELLWMIFFVSILIVMNDEDE
jgi:hypothetical protein